MIDVFRISRPSAVVLGVVTITTALSLVPTPAQGTDCSGLPRPNAPIAAPNENRTSAGILRDGVLTLHLVARRAVWYPEGPASCGLTVNAFAEEGKEAWIPGPLIRVVAGTELRVSLRNSISKPIWVRGLQDHPGGELDSIEVIPGSTREFRFRVTVRGAFYYWGGERGARLPQPNEDGQLVGAFVVDPPVGAPDDRVFVTTRWTPTGAGPTSSYRGYQLNAINGLSWPHTEQLDHAVGDSVRWQVINASNDLHMMHLHGFYFRLEARGDAAADSVEIRERRPQFVTNVLRPGEWFSILWIPERPGNWLFHCHLHAHMSPAQRLDRLLPEAAAAMDGLPDHPDPGHALHSMAGLILGVRVEPERSDPPRPTASPARELRLFANTRERVFGERPGFGFVLQDDQHEPARDSIRIPGSAIVLTREQPTRIAVHNRLDEPLAVHWHGMELESYFDGVAGWSGMQGRVAPAVPPGDSFVVHITPPRAGTFIYHVHNESGHELASGLYGPLIVVESGHAALPIHDRVFIISDDGPERSGVVFINGTTSPDTLELVVGTTYRFRIIDIASDDAHVTTLRDGSGPVVWRAVARDGADLPPEQATERPARFNSAPGVTFDYEFTPTVVGTLAVTVDTIRTGKGPAGVITTVPIRVRGP